MARVIIAKVMTPIAPAVRAWRPADTGTTDGQIRDRLIELDDLRRRGIISDEEFAAKKAELLSRI